MKYRNAVVASLVSGVLAGCSILPTGNSSRAKPTANVEDLFVSDTQVQATAADAEANRKMAVASSGLTVRKSKRGNMDSYVVRGQRFHTLDNSDGYSARGLASWYGPNFHGRTASNGEIYDMYKMTAAHKSLPLPTYARVTHLDNGKSVVVKINDRGPFSGDRIIDLSFAAALQLGMVNDGTAMVEIQALTAEELAVMSGPKNTMDIEFDYVKDGIATPVPSSALAGVALPLNNQNAVAGAGESLVVPVLPEADAAAPVTAAQTVATDVVVPVATPRPEPVASAEGVVVKVPAIQTAGSDAGKAVDLSRVATASVDEKNTAAGLPVALVDASSVGQVVPAAGVAAVQTAKAAPKLPLDNAEYFIQAGVYADVADAERLAVDIVLAIPREEVNIKPLKGTDMYRVTVGPIMKSDHAKLVSAELDNAGVENYTVKVKQP